MPELAEDMYCSQQICIPPTFPYLLRQYAKAAIRTQPGDLLRWSTAYFRCLALNLPAPVKPRLEYPIPKSHFGLTPGWLRALMHQLQNNLTVTFKVLWDRWIGACLQHENLIEVLCLGGFSDPYAIQWFRFVALCAAHLTDNLTQTMIMVCEVLTEEPEGGSAMIPLEVFTDCYKFLADIDASQPQWIRNLYFTDSLLSLYREPSVVEVKESITEVEAEEEEESVEAEEVKEEEVEAGPEEDLVGVVISCPDIAADDYKTEEDFLAQEREREAEASEVLSQVSGQASADTKAEEVSKASDSASKPPDTVSETGTKGEQADEEEAEDEETGSKLEEKPPAEEEEPQEGEEAPKEAPKEEEPETAAGTESVDTLVGYMPPRTGDESSEGSEEQAKVEEPGEEQMAEEEEEEKVDQDIEKLRQALEGAPGAPVSELFESEGSEKKEEVEEEEAPEEKGTMVFVDAIPGIGPTVPKHLVEAVVTYMKECATIQHGMVMPRNVRHFNCPPLEVVS